MFSIKIFYDYPNRLKYLFISRKTREGNLEFFQQGKWVNRKAGTAQDSSFMKCEIEEFDDFMQALVDEAWESGYKPKQHLGVGSELAATKYHLEDMRKIKDQIFDKFLTK